jgi:glutamine synthetase
MLFKYIVKNTGHAAGKTVDLHAEAGHGRQRLRHALPHVAVERRARRCSTTRSATPGLSDTARHYIGGLLHHAPSLLAFTNPTINSYHRLVPGFEAPVNLVYSQRNRSACIRIPITGQQPQGQALEFRCPDPSSNPYLAFSAMLMAGLDGIRNKIEPPTPVDKDLYELPPDELADVAQVPASLDAVLDALEADHEYLLEGGVFTEDLISTWIAYKREVEIDAIRLRPHPYEFALYYDI